MSVSGGHSKCVVALGSPEVSQKCNYCLAFKSGARKNREIKLRLLMRACSLQPTSESGQETSTVTLSLDKSSTPSMAVAGFP